MSLPRFNLPPQDLLPGLSLGGEYADQVESLQRLAEYGFSGEPIHRNTPNGRIVLTRPSVAGVEASISLTYAAGALDHLTFTLRQCPKQEDSLVAVARAERLLDVGLGAPAVTLDRLAAWSQGGVDTGVPTIAKAYFWTGATPAKAVKHHDTQAFFDTITAMDGGALAFITAVKGSILASMEIGRKS